FRRPKGITFGPVMKSGRRWERLAVVAKNYEGTLRVEIEHPLIVKFVVIYAPITGSGGPVFYHKFTVTPDGVLSTLTSAESSTFGLTLPLLENDGRELQVHIGDRSASTRYPDEIGQGDEQHFLVVNKEPVALEAGKSIRSTYGWLKPVRVTSTAENIDVFTYPRSAQDPSAQEVHESFNLTQDGFSSVLGSVEGSIYVGRFSAGGRGDSLTLKEGNEPEIVFDKTCGFMVQHVDGKITALESDANVQATVQGNAYTLKAFTPLVLI
ncbi:MAG: hypothetical protein AB8G77_15730, partial [Rhodothermales bacterium]